MHHKGTVRLETERLILRRFTVADAAEMYRNWACSEEVARYLTWEPHANAGVTGAVLRDWVAAYESPETYNWAMECKSDGMLIGNISVVKQRAEIACAELGYCMGTDFWGQGYMPEAGCAVLEFLFEQVGLNRIVAFHDIDNPKSGRVMHKIGMTKEGVLRQNGFARGRILDEVCYAILAADYRRQKNI